MKRIKYTVYAPDKIFAGITAYVIPPAPEHKGLLLVVHRALPGSSSKWVVAERTTSAAIKYGETKAEAIENSVLLLSQKTTAQIKAAFQAATEFVAKVEAGLLDVRP